MSDDDSWIFDGLICYLAGPIWNHPILNFIENKSILFEPGVAKEKEQREVHDQYKNLVDYMLVAYMEEVGLSPDQFESLCGKMTASMKDASYQLMFEQVWAADDYDIFKKMMTQKNLEFQLQVLDMLQRVHGSLSDSFKFDENMPANEKAVMKEVYKNLNEHKEEGEPCSEMSSEAIVNETKAEKQRLIQKKELFESGNSEASASAPKAEFDPEDLKKRQEHFRLHRDKLLELKRKEREKILLKYEKSSSDTQARPKSSKAAQRALKGTIGPQGQQVRRALERIKKEVIDQE